MLFKEEVGDVEVVPVSGNRLDFLDDDVLCWFSTSLSKKDSGMYPFLPACSTSHHSEFPLLSHFRRTLTRVPTLRVISEMFCEMKSYRTI